MHLDTVLGLISERETTARRNADQIHAQITALTSELARVDTELTDLVTNRHTLRMLTAAEFTADDPTVTSSAYQQILAVLEASATGMRAKDICLALDIEPLPKHVEGTRAKLKRLVSRKLLTESEPEPKSTHSLARAELRRNPRISSAVPKSRNSTATGSTDLMRKPARTHRRTNSRPIV
ncbi:hypothetical protein [Micromonospora sp. KC606]|uniref:hypothetical protein n=1 Tax=Micromonospora sp. KC606 TaxID=2530379 RepID=UPI001FB72823|nr:hypothetical protein [Micromonospora sp. KC606]